MAIAWTEGDTPTDNVRVPLWTPDGKDLVRFLSGVVWFDSHYVFKVGSRPCEGENCPHCEAGNKPRKQGYALVEVREQGCDPNRPNWLLRIMSVAAGNREKLSGDLAGLRFEINTVSSGGPAGRESRRATFRKVFADDRREATQHNPFDIRPVLEDHFYPKRKRVDLAPVEELGDELPANILKFPTRDTEADRINSELRRAGLGGDVTAIAANGPSSSNPVPGQFVLGVYAKRKEGVA